MSITGTFKEKMVLPTENPSLISLINFEVFKQPIFKLGSFKINTQLPSWVIQCCNGYSMMMFIFTITVANEPMLNSF